MNFLTFVNQCLTVLYYFSFKVPKISFGIENHTIPQTIQFNQFTDVDQILGIIIWFLYALVYCTLNITINLLLFFLYKYVCFIIIFCKSINY